MPGPLLDITVNRDVASSFGILPATIDNIAQRRLRPAHRLDDVHVAEPVSRRAGGRPAVPVRARGARRASMSTRRAASRCRCAPWSTASSSRRRSWSTIRAMFPSVTISFNLQPGVALGRAVAAIQQVEQRTGKPLSLTTSFPGQRPGLPGVAVEHAAPDPRGAGRDLHHSRHSLREHDPSDHDPVDLAVRRHRRAAAADGRSTLISA